MDAVPLWRFYEIALAGPSQDGFDVELFATFSHPSERAGLLVRGFFDGKGRYLVRFQPTRTGHWQYVTNSSRAELAGHSGGFSVSGPLPGEHGPVHADGWNFKHADGTEHFTVQTTAYAWIHQEESLREQTLQTLEGLGFNRLRMTIFPKWYQYGNWEEPPDGLYPYEGSPGNFDHLTFDPRFWRKLDGYLLRLRALGIVADLILFHPYERTAWGFITMDTPKKQRYLRYAVARLGAFSNVWWAMANEYDKCGSVDWASLFETLIAEDVHQRPRSIHFFNPRFQWDASRVDTTHISMQMLNPDLGLFQRLRDGTQCGLAKWRWEHCGGNVNGYKKPLTLDESGYEGHIHTMWGKLSAETMADRFWLTFALGMYAGHGEVIPGPGDGGDPFGGEDIDVADDQDGHYTMWWSKGGVLRGSSPEWIARFSQYAVDPWHPPFSELTPTPGPGSSRILSKSGEFAFYYFGGPCRASISIPGLSPQDHFCVRVVERGAYSRQVIASAAVGSVAVTVGSTLGGTQLIEARRGPCLDPPAPPPPPLPPLPPPTPPPLPRSLPPGTPSPPAQPPRVSPSAPPLEAQLPTLSPAVARPVEASSASATEALQNEPDTQDVGGVSAHPQALLATAACMIAFLAGLIFYILRRRKCHKSKNLIAQDAQRSEDAEPASNDVVDERRPAARVNPHGSSGNARAARLASDDADLMEMHSRRTVPAWDDDTDSPSKRVDASLSPRRSSAPRPGDFDLD